MEKIDWRETMVDIQKPYWLIVRSGDPKGHHTGTVESVKVRLFEFDNVSSLMNFHEGCSVKSGESMGAYVYDVLASSHEWSVLHELEEAEKAEVE